MGEAAVILYFTKLGYDIFTNLGGKSKSDILIEKDGIPHRVQIKTTGTKDKQSNSWIVQIAKKKYNRTKRWIEKFDSSDSDLLAVYIEPEDKVVVFASDQIKTKNELRIKKEK